MTGADLLYFNGINGENGNYALPPMTGAALSGFIQGISSPENLAELRYRRQKDVALPLAVREGVDPLKLEEAGWGIVFPQNAAPEIKEALQELIQLRREQAGARFRLYEGYNGLRPGESKNEFLSRNGSGPGPVDPDRVPYYLLLAGGPQEIPYAFQTQLDVQYAVGRVAFDTPEEYARYARSVAAAERVSLRLPRRAAFFGVEHPGDPATRLSARQLAAPLHAELSAAHSDWEVHAAFGVEADRRRLAHLLGGEAGAALLFTASHGMEFPSGSPRQLANQGALLCAEWPGPEEWYGKGPIPADFYFSADDLGSGNSPAGMVAFFFACYGAGTPLYDDFSRQAFKQRAEIAPYPFVARLPKAMLAHPGGGALAVIGHIERAWGTSFYWQGAGAQTAVFSGALQRLLKGQPVGYAMEYFNQRYAELSTILSDTLEEISFGLTVDPNELASLWTANNDARGYAVLGDPAVRLAVG